MLAAWHAIVHFFGADAGRPYGQFSPAGFWSGVAGSFLVNLVTFGSLWWWRSTCHYSKWCLRFGVHQAAGGMFRLCWKHHPDMGTRPHHDLIHDLHREWKTGQAG